LKYFFGFSPQIGSQTRVVNRSLGDLFRCLAGEKPENWDLISPHAEFEYNNSVIRSTGKSPFGIVHRLSPRQLIDLFSLSTDYQPSDYAQAFAKHIHNF